MSVSETAEPPRLFTVGALCVRVGPLLVSVARASRLRNTETSAWQSFYVSSDDEAGLANEKLLSCTQRRHAHEKHANPRAPQTTLSEFDRICFVYLAFVGHGPVRVFASSLLQ